MDQPAILALEDGSIFRGISIGMAGLTVGEVVFNTSMTGYQEILTDPSYCRQLITFTYPHIGNTGINQQDCESPQVMAAGLIIRDLAMQLSNWRAEMALTDYLRQEKLVAIAGIDTRKLTRLLREKGAQNGCIHAGTDASEATALAAARAFPGLKGMDLAKLVSTKQPYTWDAGTWQLGGVQAANLKKQSLHVVAYDYGIKRNALMAYLQGSGSPGPLEKNKPSGSSARASWALQVAGTTVTRQP